MSIASRRGCLRILLIISMCGAWISLYAQPRYVYRFSFKPPEEVFSAGFTALGPNRDLLNHVAVGSAQSAFIATTADYRVALRIARRELGSGSDRTGYIYTIAANPTFYPVTASLQDFLARGRAEGIDEEHIFLAMSAAAAMDEFRWEQEYVAAGPIWARWIRSAMPVDIVREAGGRIEVYEQARIFNRRWSPPFDEQGASLVPYPMVWPASSHAMPVCAAIINDLEDSEDSGEIQGEDCDGDLWAALDGDEYIHPALLASCDGWQQKKRSSSGMVCGNGLRLVNVSKRARVHAAVLFFGSGGNKTGWVHDEL